MLTLLTIAIKAFFNDKSNADNDEKQYNNNDNIIMFRVITILIIIFIINIIISIINNITHIVHTCMQIYQY